jgi:hypothetical protein
MTVIRPAAGGNPLASMMKRLADLARSPQGRQMAEKAKRAAQDPQNRRRIEDLRQRITKKR